MTLLLCRMISSLWLWRFHPYSCTDPNCRDSPLEFDNSRLWLDENWPIRGENYTNLVSVCSNSRRRITREIHILCLWLRELLFSVVFLIFLDFTIFLVYFLKVFLVWEMRFSSEKSNSRVVENRPKLSFSFTILV